MAAGGVFQTGMMDPDQHKYSEFMRFMRNVSDGEVKIENGQVMADDFFAAHKQPEAAVDTADWVRDFENGKASESKTPHNSASCSTNELFLIGEATESYNTQFWNRLQNEWKKISDEDDQAHPWLSELSDYYDPYKVIFGFENFSILDTDQIYRSTLSTRKTQ